MTIHAMNIPSCFRTRRQWVLWKTVIRDGSATKLPFQPNGDNAKSNDLTTWSEFATVFNHRAARTDYDGIGFVFSEDDPYCGIDLDGCRDPATGVVEPWAKEIILDVNTYAEVSPSETGVKLFILGNLPMTGKKKLLEGVPSIGGKTAAIEIYDQTRYFAMTGMRLAGVPRDPQERQDKLDALVQRFWPEAPATPFVSFRSTDAVVDRARKYLAKMPPAISGQSGHNATYHAACVLVCGFDLSEQEAYGLMSEWNAGCQPPWSERDLLRKVREAGKSGGERGYLRNVSPARWSAVSVPEYKPLKPEPKRTTIVGAMRSYIERLRNDDIQLIETGITELDHAIGGGLEQGELVVVAARPSHGKSAMALQCAHAWTASKMPCLLISEEMTAMALGKRSLQYVSDIPSEHWRHSTSELDLTVDEYASFHAQGIIAESCCTTEAAIEQIDRAVEEDKIKFVIVDYAQILRGSGKTRYEQITNTSIQLKQAAARHNIIVVLLCQLSRDIEKRTEFRPAMSDIKETGQIEQDADVIMFLVWPHRINPKEDPQRFQVFVAKNRNRGIMQGIVDCRFIPSRQMILPPKVSDMANHSQELARFNRGGFD